MSSETSISTMVRRNWQSYLWRMSLAMVILLAIALTQHVYVLDIPLVEIHPRLLIIPVLVGAVFGFLFTTVRLMQQAQHRQLELLEEKEQALRNEIELREAADRRGERLKYALEGSNDGLWDWNIQTGEAYYSPRWEQILGYDTGEVEAHVDSWRGSIHPDDATETSTMLEAHIQGKVSQFRKEMRLRTRSGEWCWVLGRGRVVETDDQGQPVRAVGTMIDISDRKRMEAELLGQNERVQITLDSIGDAVITTDADGLILYMNPVAEQITGVPAIDGCGMLLEDVCVSADEGVHLIDENTFDRLDCGEGAETVQHHIRLRNQDGEVIHIETSASPILDRDRKISGVVVVFRDVSSTHEMARQLSWQARHDALTGLANRREFENWLTELIQLARIDDRSHALLYMDLDQFKVVNDTCGHFAGDQLLRQLTSILRECVRQSDILARLGGDEFGVLLNGCSADVAVKMAEKLIETVREFRFVWEDKVFHIGVSVGVVEITPDTEDSTAVMKAADMACYAAKDSGRNRYHFYEVGDELVERRRTEMQWVGRVKEAIENEDIILYGQRIMSIEDESVHHYEVLSRMLMEDGELIPPGSFIPAAERYNVAAEIDRYVVGKIFRSLNDGDIPGDAVLSINLSGKSMSDELLLRFIADESERIGITTGSICFEITETAAVANMSDAMRFIGELHEKGFLFSLDDFGSGVSSFGYLKQLPVDFLKIDGSFVKGMVEDPIDAAMVSAINEIGRRMGKMTIAEFVEDERILDALREIGVGFAQGYHIHVPEPLEAIMQRVS